VKVVEDQIGALADIAALSDPVSASASTGSEIAAVLAAIMERIGPLMRLIDNFSQAHPYASLAWTLVSSLQKVVSKQLDEDKMVVQLATSMADAYSFTNDLHTLAVRSSNFEGNVTRMFQQTIECSLFIREYTYHGFVGTCTCHVCSFLRSRIVHGRPYGEATTH